MIVKFCPSIFYKLFPSLHAESVGFLLGSRDDEGYSITDIWPTPNTWVGDRCNNYRIHSSAFRRSRKILEIIGHAHTHITYGCNMPSKQDHNYLRDDEIGAVFYIPGWSIVWYSKGGVLQTTTMPKMPNKYRSILKLNV
jgi:hypothetical protein